MAPEKLSPRKKNPRKNDPLEKSLGKNGPREKKSSEKRSPEKWSLTKFPLKIVLRQKNARKFERLFNFHRLIPLYTQKKFDVQRSYMHQTVEH